MKERIVIDNNQHLPRASYYVAKDGHYDVGTVNYATPETILNENRIVAVKEQVPETFEELKELVNKYSGKINRQVGGITVGTTRIIIMMKFDNIYFGKNGNIYFADKYLGTYTSARQWQIIKSLIGEE